MKKKIIFLLIIILVVFQFFGNRAPNQEPTSADLFAVEQAPDEVKDLIKLNCYDCHSEQVKYPWYASVAPFSWIINDHVEDGNKHFALSKWADYSAKKKAHKMEEAREELEEGEMPLKIYTVLHRHANMSKEQKKLLIDWFRSIEKKYTTAEVL